MAQQTAVEWLIEQLIKLDKELDGRRKSDDSTVIKINPTKIYEQAKQMEKEQRIQDYNVGYTDAQCNHINDAENYVNEINYINSKEK